jgi:hypothetical protein
MKECLIHLRIKIKSLAAEATIIRQEAQKTNGMVKYGLNFHRTSVVRYHARMNLLAYGFLRGRAYKDIEEKCDMPPNFKMVEDIAKKFGATDLVALTAWIEGAKAYIKEQKNGAKTS